MQAIFELNFENGDFISANLFAGYWKTLSYNKKIKTLTFKMFNYKTIRLEGYNEYNLAFEKMHSNHPSLNGISKVFIMGRTDTKSDVVVFDLLNKSINKYTTPIGNEYQTKTTGWKLGTGGTPKLWSSK